MVNNRKSQLENRQKNEIILLLELIQAQETEQSICFNKPSCYLLRTYKYTIIFNDSFKKQRIHSFYLKFVSHFHNIYFIIIERKEEGFFNKQKIEKN